MHNYGPVVNTRTEATENPASEVSKRVVTDSIQGFKKARIENVRIWTEEEFFGAEAQWQDLLLRSDADPLFMSWVWQVCWWRHNAKPLNSQLRIYAAYADDQSLVGLAPFHVRKVTHRGLFSSTRLEFLGSSFRDSAGSFSEYLDFIVDRDYIDLFLAAIAKSLQDGESWSDLVLGNTATNGLAASFVRGGRVNCAYIREIDKLTAHITTFQGCFSDYLKVLTPAVRRKLWNHRSKLAMPTLTTVQGDGIDSFFELLNSYHAHRWGADAFKKMKMPFYADIARHFFDRGMLQMSYLCHAGKPISAMFNVRAGNGEYNIQSGFDPNALPHASPGYLHFGFAIENAHAQGVGYFNFLAGKGRTRDYKQDFVTAQQYLGTFQVIKARPLAWLYRGYDRRFISLVSACAPYFGSLMEISEGSYVGAFS